MKTLWRLFVIFFRIGLFTFGGGYAMVSLIEEQIVERNKFLTKEEFIDIIAIVQTFPGAIAINLANYIGRQLGGTAGALAAMAGATVPSLMVILLIAIFYVQFSAQTWWLKFVNGLLPVILALIIKSGLGMYKKAVKSKVDLVVFVVAMALMIVGIHPLLIILTGGLLGIVRQWHINGKIKHLAKNEG